MDLNPPKPEKKPKIPSNAISSAPGLKAQIGEMIGAIFPLDNIERKHQNFVKEWIASGVEIFRIKKPATPPIHLVSYFTGSFRLQ